MRTMIENRRERLALAEDAGWGRVSMASVLAGLLVGYGAFAILAGLAAAVFAVLDLNVELSGDDWRRAGTAGGIALGFVLFGSWLFGGYVAGRMARRAGATQGVLVFAFGILVALAAAAVVEASGSRDGVIEGVRNLGIPTTGEQWGDVFTVAGVASLAGMLLGSMLGGALGERWHSKLISRALDPKKGPEALAAANRSKVIRAKERRFLVRGQAGGRSTPEPKSPTPTPAPPEESAPPTQSASSGQAKAKRT